MVAKGSLRGQCPYKKTITSIYINVQMIKNRRGNVINTILRLTGIKNSNQKAYISVDNKWVSYRLRLRICWICRNKLGRSG